MCVCCFRFNTELLLANLFEHSNYPVKYSYEEVHDYFRFMTDKFPTYLSTDLSEQALYDCAAEYPEVYAAYKDEDRVMIESKDFKPNLKYFNSCYPVGVSHYLGVVTDEYLSKVEDN